MTEHEQNHPDSFEADAERSDPQSHNDAAFFESGAGNPESGAEDLQRALADRDKYLDNWQRCVAETENVRKRMFREIEQERQYRSLPIARDLLPAVDNLQRALQAAETSKDVGQLTQGIKMVLQQIEETFTRHSITSIATVGEPFDPNLHEAILQQPSADSPPMTVLTEVEKGYRMHDRVVRPSKVIVSSGPPEQV